LRVKREVNIIKIDNAKAKSELENSRAEIENTRAMMQMLDETIAALSADSEDPEIAEKIKQLKDRKLLLADKILELVSA